MDRLMDFVEAHFGDFVAITVLYAGVHLVTHANGAETIIRLGDVLVGGALWGLRLKSNGKGAS